MATFAGRYIHFAGAVIHLGMTIASNNWWGERDRKEAIMCETTQPPTRAGAVS